MNRYEIVLSVISVTLVLLLLLSVLSILFIHSAKLKIKQEIETAQNKLNYEKELRKVEIEVGEQTLSQVAVELHDNINSILTAAHISLENQKIDYPEMKEKSQQTGTYIKEAMEQIRSLSRSLNSDYIGNIGLFGAFEIEVNKIIALKRFEVHFPAFIGSSNLDNNQELMVFRIFQEIMQNSLKHSSAKNVYISINNSNGNFELKVEDDGRGFNAEYMIESNKASGLRNILKRSAYAGLKCKITSFPGNGCSTEIHKVKNSIPV